MIIIRNLKCVRVTVELKKGSIRHNKGKRITLVFKIEQQPSTRKRHVD